MRTPLGALLALAAALPLILLPISGASAARPAGVRGHSAHAHAHPHGVPHLSSGHAEAALRRARAALGRHAPAADRPADARATRPPTTGHDATLALRDLWLARPSLTGADRRAASAMLARPTEGRSDGEDVVSYTATERLHMQQLCNEHFCVHWTTARNAGEYADGSGTTYREDNAATESDAARTLDTLSHVWSVEVGKLGYRAPLSDVATINGTDNPDGRIDVYLVDLRPLGYYGYCQPDDLVQQETLHAAAYCVLDNDYANYGDATPIDALRVTAAHEFFHAIQFAYDVDEDRWFMEGSAVWVEDEVYNGINDYVQYVQSPRGYGASAASPISNPGTSWDHSGQYNVYGDFTVFKFLAATLGSADVVRQMWADADAYAHPGVYSLEALNTVLHAHHRSPLTLMALFGAWNTLPPHSYPERRTYQPAHFWRTRTVGSRGTGLLATSLPHLASAPARFRPARSLGRRAHLRVSLDLPPVSHGAAATVQVRRRNGHVSLHTIRLTKAGRATVTVPFDPRSVASVIVVMTNGSTAMVDCSHARDGRYSCGGYGRYAGRYTIRAHVV